ncbi:MAG: dihydroorotase [Bacteroidales bacterium]
MKPLLINNALIINENTQKTGSLLIKDGVIEEIYYEATSIPKEIASQAKQMDASNKILIPGVIDEHVHFRQPGMEHKAEIQTESRAAIAGGVTSFMEMPNTIPQATTNERLEEKFTIANEKSLANYSFYLGATNKNIREIQKADPKKICGVKAFLGSSTGNMLLDDKNILETLFKESSLPIVAHCEDEYTIQRNLNHYKNIYGKDIPVSLHPAIRSTEACYKSSSFAVDLAEKYGTKFHVLHLSTAKELSLFNNVIPLKEKKITAEVCIHHLWFQDTDYDKFGTKIKWNPAIKSSKDREGLLKGLMENKIDAIATDHAPHTLQEKTNPYTDAPSGGPMIQHSLQAMLDLYNENILSLTTIVDKMCHAPADIFKIKNRGYIKKGYYADLVIIDLDKPYTVDHNNILYKCRWSPMEGYRFKSSITHTFVNGVLVYNKGKILNNKVAKRLEFER